ncbi:MAG: transcriptional repressor LexA, partial [Gammaproteobacteria bacterium]
MKLPLTSQQQKLLNFLLEHTRTKGHPPTVREIGRAFGFRSTGTVRDHLRALETKGYVRKHRGKSRGLLLQSWLRSLPILGRVPAGGPLLAEENVEGTVDLSREFGGENVFALKVHGDSMVDAGICEDDLVVVRRQDHAEAGQIVVAMVDGEATVKKFMARGAKRWLQPANSRYEPIPVEDDTRIVGRVPAGGPLLA